MKALVFTLVLIAVFSGLTAGYMLEYRTVDADSNATDIGIMIEDEGIRLKTPMVDLIINNEADKLYIIDAKSKMYTAMSYSQLTAMMQGMMAGNNPEGEGKNLTFRPCAERHDYDGKSMLRYKVFDNDELITVIYIDDSRKIESLPDKLNSLSDAMGNLPVGNALFGDIVDMYDKGIPYAVLFYENGNEAARIELKSFEEGDYSSKMTPPSDYSKQE